jgi:hypothetical protein
MQRFATAIAVLAVLAAVAAVAVNTLRDPYDSSRANLELRIQEAAARPDIGDEEFKANYDEWEAAVQARPNLWDSLTPPPVKQAPPMDPSKAMAGISLLPGSTKTSVRLATPENSRGRMYKAGDTVTAGVVIQEIAADKVVFKVTEGSQSAPFSMPRR